MTIKIFIVIKYFFSGEAENDTARTKKAKPSDKLNQLSQDVESLTEVVKSHSDTIESLSSLPDAIQALTAKIDSMNGDSSVNWDEDYYNEFDGRFLPYN